MTAPIVVMLEEPSARIIINEICKKLEIDDLVMALQHDGKSDLEKSIVPKINGWRSHVPAYFIISRDLDSASRAQLRDRLIGMVPAHALARTKIRIIVPELESWYLGDTTALVDAGLISQNIATRIENQAKFRNLCNLNNAKMEFKKIVGSIGQIEAAHRIGPNLIPERNRCRNFTAFIEALHWAAAGVKIS